MNSRRVEYLVIGGVAAIAYGVPRLTVDLGLPIDATPANAAALLAALSDSGLGTASLTTTDELLNHEITIFRDRIRVDVRTRTYGIDFREEWARRNTVRIAETPVHLVSLVGSFAPRRRQLGRATSKTSGYSKPRGHALRRRPPAIGAPYRGSAAPRISSTSASVW